MKYRIFLVNSLFSVSIFGSTCLPLFDGFVSLSRLFLIVSLISALCFLIFYRSYTLASLIVASTVLLAYFFIGFTREDGIFGFLPFLVTLVFTSTFVSRAILPSVTNSLYFVFLASFTVLAALSSFSFELMPVSTSINSFGFLNLFFSTLAVFNLYLHRRLTPQYFYIVVVGFVFSLFTVGTSNILTSLLLLFSVAAYFAKDLSFIRFKHILLLASAAIPLYIYLLSHSSYILLFADNLSLFNLSDDIRFQVVQEFFDSYKLYYLYSFYDSSDLHVLSTLEGNFHNSYLYAFQYLGFGLVSLVIVSFYCVFAFLCRTKSLFPFLFILPFVIRGFSDTVLFFHLSDLLLFSPLFFSLIPTRNS